MQLIQLRLCPVLLIITILYTPEGTTADCDDWRLKGTDEVCCLRCRPGNLLLEECGKDRTKLCAPCGPNTYNIEPLAPYCKTCTQCIDPQVQVKPCTASTDTVCGCKEGFRCGDKQCRYCVMECPKGEQPTYTRRCAKCPEGTFNDEIHSRCKPWRKRCPNGESMIANGTAFSDIMCSRIPVNTPSAPKEIPTPKPTERPEAGEIPTPKPTERPEAGDNSFYALLGCFGAGFTLTVIIILSLWLAYNRTKNKSNSKDLKPTTPTQGELTIMMVEHEEACSFHQPEQEQGGSSESINTQNSETKLLV